MNTAVTHFRVVLRVKKTRILPLLSTARVICSAMLAEAERFPLPVPSLATVLGQINALDTAQQAVASGNRGAATSTRNTARDTLCSSLASLKAYVQLIADASVDEAFTIIKSSGFDVRALPSRSKPVLDAQMTSTSGMVKLVANALALTGGARKHVVYNWQYSTDGGQSWVLVPSTSVSMVTIGGLPAMTHCTFRVSVTLRQQMQPWSQVVTIPVV